MKQNNAYENELFIANRLLTAFTVSTEDNEIAMVIGLSKEIYQYDEEGLITACVTALEPLVDLYPNVYKVEILNEDSVITTFVSLVRGMNNTEINMVVEALGGTLVEPINEITQPEGDVITTLTIKTDSLAEYYKIRKG